MTTSRSDRAGDQPASQDAPDRSRITDFIHAKVSRTQALKAIGLGAAAATAFPSATHAEGSSYSFPFYPSVASGQYTPESIPDIVTNILTQDYLHAAFAAALVLNPTLAATFGTNAGLPRAHFQSLAAIHQDQIDFWTSLFPQIRPITAFTAPAALLTGPQALFPAGEAVDSLRAATLIAAVREFAELGQPTLARYAAQQVAIEGGIWTALRFLEAAGGSSSAIPPVNKAFATALVLYTADAIAILKSLGLIGGSGVPVAYPGRDTVVQAAGPMWAAVVQARPGSGDATIQVTGLPSLTGPRP